MCFLKKNICLCDRRSPAPAAAGVVNIPRSFLHDKAQNGSCTLGRNVFLAVTIIKRSMLQTLRSHKCLNWARLTQLILKRDKDSSRASLL